MSTPPRKLDKVDWIGVVVCVLIGITVTDIVGRQLQDKMDFWPAFGIKVAVGGVVGLIGLVIWLGLIRHPKN